MAKPYNYLTDPKLRKLYEFHLHDVVCKTCGICNSGSHDWTKINHNKKCKLYKGKIMSFFDAVDTGQMYDFYGVDNHTFKLDDTIFEVLEDESDGYRSYLDTVVVIDKTNLIFPRQPFTPVKVIRDDTNSYEFYKLVDPFGHAWLTFGTDYTYDYYPCFSFHYNPNTFEETNV